MINSGKMRYKISLAKYENVITEDGFKTQLVLSSDYNNVYSTFEPISVKQYFNNNLQNNDILPTYKFVIRLFSKSAESVSSFNILLLNNGLNQDNLIDFGEQFDIIECLPDNKSGQEYITLLCKRKNKTPDQL